MNQSCFIKGKTWFKSRGRLWGVGERGEEGERMCSKTPGVIFLYQRKIGKKSPQDVLEAEKKVDSSRQKSKYICVVYSCWKRTKSCSYIGFFNKSGCHYVFLRHKRFGLEIKSHKKEVGKKHIPLFQVYTRGSSLFRILSGKTHHILPFPLFKSLIGDVFDFIQRKQAA